jgi:hypothetical protein
MIHRVEDDLRDLRPSRIVEEDESLSPVQCRESRTNTCNGKRYR